MTRTRLPQIRKPLGWGACNYVPSYGTVQLVMVSCWNAFQQLHCSLNFSSVQKYKTIKCSLRFSDAVPCFNIFLSFSAFEMSSHLQNLKLHSKMPATGKYGEAYK